VSGARVSSAAAEPEAANNSNNNAGSEERFMSAWSEVWKDIQAIIRAAPNLRRTVKPQDEDVVTVSDEAVAILAQSLVGDVYLSVSQCHNDLETVDDRRNQLVESLIHAFDVHRHCRTVCVP